MVSAALVVHLDGPGALAEPQELLGRGREILDAAVRLVDEPDRLARVVEPLVVYVIERKSKNRM